MGTLDDVRRPQAGGTAALLDGIAVTEEVLGVVDSETAPARVAGLLVGGLVSEHGEGAGGEEDVRSVVQCTGNTTSGISG